MNYTYISGAAIAIIVFAFAVFTSIDPQTVSVF